MSKEMLGAGLAAAAAAISASPKARKAIRDAGLDAADSAQQAAGSMASSASKLGELIAEAVADAAQRVMSGRWSDVEKDASGRRMAKRNTRGQANPRAARPSVMKSNLGKAKRSTTHRRIHEATITEHIDVSSGVEARLVAEVEAMIAQSGEPAAFDAKQWVHDWIRYQVPALDGKRPIDLLNTDEGRELVSTTLARMQSGAYA